ncbi:GatB/YqeY domain-containing protein [Geoalkalibacter halelectricus]|uniref:GatB/YqeY domain-containing protein n=1 Tax=Geoalkalibacter halelectricus TaxID=2847045 RepID=A0ABY5ZS35_9BACT|nr:GatB/YqeY domain-containing protein [Geoalkalibacter halelectricus]MDO3377653.1 GatB/YqeY domain-containing protein [Geoalkalibacter halelectricus]UWZ81443.1 GatB/YqeY domain-containing protein [Geoalkalibacter halelectricus]
MSLNENLNTAMKEAMKAKDSLRLSAIRLIRSAIKNREIEERRPLDDEGIIAVLSTLAKQRRDSVEAYRQSGREDLAEKEEKELAVIQEFLPRPLSEEEIAAIIDQAVAQTGAAGPRDMGKVMKIVSAETKGRADGRLVSERVKTRLGG